MKSNQTCSSKRDSFFLWEKCGGGSDNEKNGGTGGRKVVKTEVKEERILENNARVFVRVVNSCKANVAGRLYAKDMTVRFTGIRTLLMHKRQSVYRKERRKIKIKIKIKKYCQRLMYSSTCRIC